MGLRKNFRAENLVFRAVSRNFAVANERVRCIVIL